MTLAMFENSKLFHVYMGRWIYPNAISKLTAAACRSVPTHVLRPRHTDATTPALRTDDVMLFMLDELRFLTIYLQTTFESKYPMCRSSTSIILDVLFQNPSGRLVYLLWDFQKSNFRNAPIMFLSKYFSLDVNAPKCCVFFFGRLSFNLDKVWARSWRTVLSYCVPNWWQCAYV